MSTKIYLETPDEFHAKIKRLQFDYLEKGIKKNLKELYYEIIEKGLNAMEKEIPLAKNP